VLGWVLTVVDQFVLRWCQVVAGAVQPAVVVPVDPFQSGQFDIVEAAPGTAVVNQFGFEQADLVSARALSYASPTEPTLGATPASASRSVKAIEVYCSRSRGRCNTGCREQD
jgi:hypothetical protein